jgi:hypothetical protein
MAKKVVATLRTSTGKDYAKVYHMEKSPKTGAYMWKETIIPNDSVKEFLSKKA